MRKAFLGRTGRLSSCILSAFCIAIGFFGCGHYEFFQPARGQPYHLREDAGRQAILPYGFEEVWAAAAWHLGAVDQTMRKRWDDVDSYIWSDRKTGLMVYTAILNKRRYEMFDFVVHSIYMTELDLRSTRILYSFKKLSYFGQIGGYADFTSMAENPLENLRAIADRLEGRGRER